MFHASTPEWGPGMSDITSKMAMFKKKNVSVHSKVSDIRPPTTKSYISQLY